MLPLFGLKGILVAQIWLSLSLRFEGIILKRCEVFSESLHWWTTDLQWSENQKWGYVLFSASCSCDGDPLLWTMYSKGHWKGQSDGGVRLLLPNLLPQSHPNNHRLPRGWWFIFSAIEMILRNFLNLWNLTWLLLHCRLLNDWANQVTSNQNFALQSPVSPSTHFLF